MKRFKTVCLAACSCAAAMAQNPYLPLWEHIPDGEPYVFEDPDRPGSKRLYIYGSHDELRTGYCGLNQVVWSAPVENLSEWRYDGVAFTSRFAVDGSALNPDSRGDVLFAPDVVEMIENGKKVYYLCPNNQAHGRTTMIAKSDRPDGPFHVCNWNDDGRTTSGVFGFDPAIFRDDDGRVYGYWGFERSYAAELDPATMCSVKPGTEIVEDLVSSYKQPGLFRFFEASSIRKIKGKYVFVYSRKTENGEFGLPASNYTLAYAYSDNPLGPFTYGGTLIDGRGRDRDEQGNVIATATPNGNTHGSLVEVGGQWYVMYHRQSGLNEYSRQAMAAPVEVSVEDGKVVISEGEYTSEGFALGGLNPFVRQPAGIACYYTGPEPAKAQYPDFIFSGSYVAATYEGDNGLDAAFNLHGHHAPVVNNTAGSVVGYKYFNFDAFGGRDEAEISLCLKPSGLAGEIVFMLDSPWESKGGRVVGRLKLPGGNGGKETELVARLAGLKDVKGKHAFFMRFNSDTPAQSLCELYNFIFR